MLENKQKLVPEVNGRRSRRGPLSCVAFTSGALRSAINSSGRSREQIAVRAGISIVTLYRAQSGKPVIRAVAQAIARAVGVGLRSLLADDSTKQAEAASAA